MKPVPPSDVYDDRALCRFVALIAAIRLIDEKARELGRPMWDHTLSHNPKNCVKFDGKAIELFVEKVGDKICAAHMVP